MRGGQAQLKAKGRRPPTGALAFAERDGFVEHPLLRRGAIAVRAYQVEIARRALAASTLVVLPTGLGKTAIAALVAAERLRQAGGFVLVLAPTRPLARQHAEAMRTAAVPSLSGKVALVTGSAKREERARAFEAAWIVVSTPETVVAELEAERLVLSRCSLLVVDEAHRAVGSCAYVEVARALRRDRPGGLVLALTASPGGERRRIAAVMDALGIRQVEVRTRDDADVAPYVEPLEVEVVEVDLDEPLRQIEALLEAELAQRVAPLEKLQVLPRVATRYLGKRELAAAGDRLRARHQRNHSVFFEAAKAHAQAVLLVHALELVETRGARPLADFLGRLGESPDASRAERALAALPSVKDARLMARGLSSTSHPKVAKLIAVLQDLFRERPGARALVFAQYRDTARALKDALERPPPVGPGLSSALFLGQRRGAGGEGLTRERQEETVAAFADGRVKILVSTSVGEEGLHLPTLDLVLFFEAVASEIRMIQRHGRAGRTHAGRVVVLVSKDTRDEGALAAVESREARMTSAVRWLNAGSRTRWPPSGRNRQLLLDELGTARTSGPSGGRGG